MYRLRQLRIRLSVRLIAIVDDKASIKMEGCNLCGACQDACAAEAIKIEKEMAQTPLTANTMASGFLPNSATVKLKALAWNCYRRGGNWPILCKPNYVPSVWDMISKVSSNFLSAARIKSISLMTLLLPISRKTRMSRNLSGW